MSEVNVCLSPALIPLFGVEKYIVVIIDIFRVLITALRPLSRLPK
jgi:hypothetical protein